MAQEPYFHIFDFFSEIEHQMALHIMPEDSLNLGHHNFKYYRETPSTGILIWFLFARDLKIFFSKTTQQTSEIFYTISTLVCVINVCLNGSATYITYIIGQFITKDN